SPTTTACAATASVYCSTCVTASAASATSARSRARSGRLLQVIVEHFASDAPRPVEIASPDHEKESSHRGGTRAFLTAHPGRMAERGRKVARTERRVRCDLDGRDAEWRVARQETPLRGGPVFTDDAREG